jgi:rubrerythrin
MEQEYYTECEVCDTETHVLVVDADEIPEFCPMCGEMTEYQPFDSDI